MTRSSSDPARRPQVAAVLPVDAARATLLGRAWVPDVGPCVVTVRDGAVVDLTSREAPTARDVFERPDAAAFVAKAPGRALGSADALAANSWEAARDAKRPWLLAPVDLQAVKAAGVTFAVSLLERVIEEQARGDASKAEGLRAQIHAALGTELRSLRPGSPQALEVKQLLIARGLWSQYLEVGIGPDPEVFTKAQPMSAVGHGAHVGIPPFSQWNNPEPEVVLVATSGGAIVGATLGNDVNLRDVEGRSALLLGKAKDNNASAAIGPFVRLFDRSFTLDDVRSTTVTLRVHGDDGFELAGESSLNRISRDPADLMRATVGEHHQYPDGVCLFLGTMFAPVQDRDGVGKGFTHHSGDVVEIAAERLGCLANTVRPTAQCASWTFGAGALMQNLAARGLLASGPAHPARG
ncbi:MAG: fumarylacetoacetate hydrolase family protein [Planctomycetota bacterium]